MTQTLSGQDLDIPGRVKNILYERLGADPKQIEDEHTHVVDDLGADSLDCIEIAMALEEAFEIEILDIDMEEVETVQDLIDLVTAELMEKAR